MRVLVACEFSGTVRDAFAAQGHDAWSCDLLPTERPGQHIQGDVLGILDQSWDLLIAHPPCTYLTNAGTPFFQTHHKTVNALTNGDRVLAMYEAAAFFNRLLYAPIQRIAVENPVMSRLALEQIGPPTQRLRPWQFGNPDTKTVCLWLKGLPKLMPTATLGVERRRPGLNYLSPSADRAMARSRFFPEVAEAMARQWSVI